MGRMSRSSGYRSIFLLEVLGSGVSERGSCFNAAPGNSQDVVIAASGYSQDVVNSSLGSSKAIVSKGLTRPSSKPATSSITGGFVILFSSSSIKVHASAMSDSIASFFAFSAAATLIFILA